MRAGGATAPRPVRDTGRGATSGRPPWHETGFVFTTEFSQPCDPRNSLRALKVAAARAGLPDAGLHTLGHSAASVMLTHGVPLEVVSEILGHSSIAITGDVYSHAAPDVSREAVDILGDVLGR